MLLWLLCWRNLNFEPNRFSNKQCSELGRFVKVSYDSITFHGHSQYIRSDEYIGTV